MIVAGGAALKEGTGSPCPGFGWWREQVEDWQLVIPYLFGKILDRVRAVGSENEACVHSARPVHPFARSSALTRLRGRTIRSPYQMQKGSLGWEPPSAAPMLARQTDRHLEQ